VDTVEDEREDGYLLLSCADQANSRDLAHPVGSPAEKLALPGSDAIAPNRVDVVECCRQAQNLRDRRRTRLEPRRRGRPGTPLQGDLFDHVAAPLPGRHLRQHGGTTVEGAYPRWTVQLVAGTREEIAAQLGDIDRQVGRGLGAIHQHEGPASARACGQLTHGVDGSQGIRDMPDGEEFRAIAEQLLECVEIELTAVGDRNDPEPGARLLTHQLPGHQVRVVLHRRHQDFVAGP
jgi:hypothetical protein